MGLPSPFEVDVRAMGSGRVVVTVSGELDISSVEVLRRALGPELTAGQRVLLDLSGVSFIDSTGLAEILTAVKTSHESGAQLRLSADLSQQALQLMETTGTLPLLWPVIDDGSTLAED